MIVAMQEKATEEQIDAVIDVMVDSGLRVHRTTGASQTILAGVGPTPSMDLNKFEVLDGVLHVHRISSPYKLAGRPFRPEGTVVEFPNGATIGGNQVAIIAGPCAIESEEQIHVIAKCVKAAGGGFLRGGAFKPRSSPYAFQGMGIPGLKLMHEAAQENGLLTVSEVMEISQIEAMLPYTDLFQVGARNFQNFNLLRELGQIRKPVLLKRGIAATIEELLLSAEYILSGGNYDLFCANAAFGPMKHPRATPWIFRRFRWCTSCRICPSSAILRTARAGGTWWLRWPRRLWLPVQMRFWWRFTRRQTRPLPTPRRRCTSISLRS